MTIRERFGLYQKWGVSVIPVVYRDKRPLVDWKEYQSRRPDNEEVAEWWDRYWTDSDANIGIVCGRVSDNLVVLDFDSTHNVFIEGDNSVSTIMKFITCEW